MISIECRASLLRYLADFRVWINLDANGLTCVHVLCEQKGPRRDFGLNRRRVERFFEALDNVFGPGTHVRN